MKSSIILYFIFFSTVTSGQIRSLKSAENLITNSWILDSLSINGIMQTLTSANKNSKLILRNNHNSESIGQDGLSDKGVWKFLDGTKILLIRTPDNDSIVFNIIALKKNRLVISVINKKNKDLIVTDRRNQN